MVKFEIEQMKKIIVINCALKSMLVVYSAIVWIIGVIRNV